MTEKKDTGRDPRANFGWNRLSRRSLLRGLPFLGLVMAVDREAARRWVDRIASRRITPPLRFDDAEEIVGAADRVALVDPLSDEGAFSKIHDFDRTYDDDVVETDRLDLLISAASRIERAVRVIGHGHFNLTSFRELVNYARQQSSIGRFTTAELEYLEELFHTDARLYGFYGDKVLQDQAATISIHDVAKVPGSGHYLLRGEPLEKYRRIRRDIGDGIVLTSGVRGIAKQFQLFLSKAVETGGNLSQASRSLAPPGYSYHAIGDFDIGRAGFGLKNFTEEFAKTDEYRKLIDLGYADIRYTETNPYGVRHEPWHMKIA